MLAVKFPLKLHIVCVLSRNLEITKLEGGREGEQMRGLGREKKHIDVGQKWLMLSVHSL